MRRSRHILLLTAVLVPMAAPAMAAPGLADLERALDLLPRVERFEADARGRLTAIEGELTPPGQSPPRRTAVAFLAIHAPLLGAADRSVFRAEQVVRSGRVTTVMVRQEVDGFLASGPALRLDFADSVLTRFEGTVLGDEDLAPAGADALSRDRAVAAARRALGRPAGADSAGARRVIVAGRRCWQVELNAEGHGAGRATMVTIDGFSGEVIESAEVELGVDPKGPVPAPEPDDGPDASITGCTPWLPPVGDFGTAAGQQQWSGADTGCGRWLFDPQRGASLFRGNCMEYLCAPYPATDGCDHGEITRGGLALEPGYERARIEVLTPDREIFMRLRWGRTAMDAAPFVVPRGPGATSVIELDLALYETWDSAAVRSLTLELVDDESIWLQSFDLLPGPWLELPRGPELVPDEPGSPLQAGMPATVRQNVENLGCGLEAGAPHPMRSVSYDLYERVGSTLRFEGTVCEHAEIPGAIPAESAVRGLPMCRFDLPAAGTWRLEGRFDEHSAPPAATDFVVAPAAGPDLAIDLGRPLDLYSGNLSMWPCRADVLDRARYVDPDPPCSLPYVVALEAWASGLTGPVETLLRAWARPHDPAADPGACDPDSGSWHPLGAPVAWTFTGGGTGPISLPLDEGEVLALPLGADGWSVIDLAVAIEPVAGEDDVANNRACIASWIPVIDGELASELGPTWVADDYVFPPEHWPPVGMSSTGVVLAHVGGAAWYEPDSALAVMRVEPGANEPPRVVWFEQIQQAAVAGLLLRYRRAVAGYGGPATFDAGCAESDGVPVFDLEPPGNPNRAHLTADSQWRTIAWRRGDAAPFGAFPVPQLVSPATSGSLLSLHLAPDSNCVPDEPGCPSGLHPETMIDVVGVWRSDGPPSPEPVFAVVGLRARSSSGGWVPAPASVTLGETVEYGVEIRNVGTAAGTAALTAEVVIRPASETTLDTTISGSATVAMPVGGSYVLPLAPPWQPASPGLYLLSGWVRESGVDIGHLAETVDVVLSGPGCPIPIVSLP